MRAERLHADGTPVLAKSQVALLRNCGERFGSYPASLSNLTGLMKSNVE
jgi:hypothetical protein